MPENIQDVEQRFPVWQVNAFRQWVIAEIRRRKSSYPTPINAPFVRLTSCLVEQTYQYLYFTLGLHGYKSPDVSDDLFELTYGGGREIVGYAYDMRNADANGLLKKRLISADEISANIIPDFVKQALGEKQAAAVESERQEIQTAQSVTNVPAEGAHPIPGITDVQVTRRGLGVPVVATVKWQCYNRYQLEYLRHHFLLVGNYVVLEWGQQFTDKQITTALPFGDVTAVREAMVQSIMTGRGYTIKNWNEPNDGNYDFLAGMVGNFKVGLDSTTGIYTCSTTIYSVGELPWGLSNSSTFVLKEPEPSSPEAQKVVTFQDYFAHGGQFDEFVNANSGIPSLVAQTQASWAANEKNVNSDVSELKDFSQNPNDYKFISWECFANGVIAGMFALITHPNIKNDLFKFMNFYDSQNAREKNKTIWIGDNQYLRSTNPDEMILVKKSMSNVPAGFTGAGYFDEFPDAGGYRGMLRRGVWLNTGMIRDAFLSTPDFATAMNLVLKKMSDATHGYWDLNLFFDEENSVYRVVDQKYGDPKIGFSLYKFNNGEKGELLNIDLDSAFPPMLISQMALFAKFKMDKLRTPEGKLTADQLLKEFPAIGTPSTFIFSLNWTNLNDILERDLAYRRNNAGMPLEPLPEYIAAPTMGTNSNEVDNKRGITKLVAPVNRLAGVVLNNQSSPPPGVSLNTNGISVPASRLTPSATPMRNSVTPVVAVANTSGIKVNIPNDRKKSGASLRRNNPGNLTYAGQPTATRGDPKDGGGYWAQFQTPEDGFFAVVRQIDLYKSRGYTLRKTINTYAPSFENDTSDYLNYMSTKLGVPPDTPLVYLDSTEVARRIVYRESQTTITGFAPPQPTILADGSRVIPTKTPPPSTTTTPNGTPVTNASNPGTPSNAPNNTPSSTPSSTPATAGTTSGPTVAQQQAAAQTQATIDQITIRYGEPFLNLIQPSPSIMMNQITHDGYASYPTPNSFVAFPTTTTVELDIVGISGISVGDGFYVDKLPFIFERHGCFQTTTITESITDRGWITKIRGIFKMMNLNGTGPDSTPQT